MNQNKLSLILLLISQGISLVGGAVLRFAISLHVLDLTGSAEIFATMIAVSFLPMVLFMPLGGAIADRFNKKNILVISDSANAFLVGTLALLLFGGIQSVFLLGATITLLTVTSVCYSPTVTASLPVILPENQLVKANGYAQGIKAVSSLAGPIMAGFLFGALGVNMLVGICAVLFLFSALINIFIKIPHTAQNADGGIIKNILADIKAGLVYVTKENTTLFKAAALFTIIMFFYQALLSVAFPYMIRITFAMSEQAFGFANAAIGFSILIASLLSGRLKNYMRMEHLPYYVSIMGIISAPIAISVIMGAGNIMPFIVMTASFMAIMFIFTLINILVLTYTQIHVPKQMVGKAIAMVITIANLSAPIGQFVMGLFIENLAGGQFALYMGIAIFTCVLGLAARRTFRLQPAN